MQKTSLTAPFTCKIMAIPFVSETFGYYHAMRTAESLRPIVSGAERFSEDAALSGKILISELGCAACHAADDAELARKSAPILDRVASRLRPDHMLASIAAPHQTKAGTTMRICFMTNRLQNEPSPSRPLRVTCQQPASESTVPAIPRRLNVARNYFTLSVALPATHLDRTEHIGRHERAAWRSDQQIHA